MENKTVTDLHNVNWINDKEVHKCEGTGISRWTVFGDKSYNVAICKYSDTVLDLKIKMTDFRKDKEVAVWMGMHEAQVLMEALKLFFKDVKKG